MDFLANRTVCDDNCLSLLKLKNGREEETSVKSIHRAGSRQADSTLGGIAGENAGELLMRFYNLQLY